MFNLDWAKRSHKGLRRWVLYIVRDKPRTGSEIMDIMEANLQGWWRPSPGSIYPLLEGLVKEGLVTKSEDRRYSLTERGREEIEHPFPFLRNVPAQPPRSVEEVLSELSNYVAYLEDVAQARDGRLTSSATQLREIGSRLNRLVEA